MELHLIRHGPKNNDPNCGLCHVGSEDYRIIFQNEYAVATMILNPVNSTHHIVVPRRHLEKMGEFEPSEAKGMFDLQYQVQQRLMELFPDHPPVISIQTGKLSTIPHIHWQAYSSDAHIRQLYARAHEITDNPIGGKGIIWKDARTHPIIPGTEKENIDSQKNLETFLGAAAQSLRGSGEVEKDRKRLTELTQELLRYNRFVI